MSINKKFYKPCIEWDSTTNRYQFCTGIVPSSSLSDIKRDNKLPKTPSGVVYGRKDLILTKQQVYFIQSKCWRLS